MYCFQHFHAVSVRLRKFFIIIVRGIRFLRPKKTCPRSIKIKKQQQRVFYGIFLRILNFCFLAPLALRVVQGLRQSTRRRRKCFFLRYLIYRKSIFRNYITACKITKNFHIILAKTTSKQSHLHYSIPILYLQIALCKFQDLMRGKLRPL